jgi:hypothetical protein
MDYPSGLGRNLVQILALNVYVLSYHTLPRVSFHLKTRQGIILYDEESLLKPDLVELGIPPFLASLLLCLVKRAKMGYLANYCSVSPHSCCNDILYWKVDYSYKNDTNRVSWWWDMTDWRWKVGFTPRAIRHVHPYWQLSSLGVISYIWVLSLESASWGAHTTQGTFQKHPLFSTPSTTSAILAYLLKDSLYSFLSHPRLNAASAAFVI